MAEPRFRLRRGQAADRARRAPSTRSTSCSTVGEGPRVYVERIDISGNTRTKDKVIRREFRIAEGDAFDAGHAPPLTRQRLQDLGYFNGVTVVADRRARRRTRPSSTTVVDEKATGELTLGGGYSTDAGALINVGLRERNLIGTGIDASVNGVLAQKSSQIDLSVTDPFFLDRNLAAGIDLFNIRNNNQSIAAYSERRTGGALRIGYEFNEHLRQAWTYSLVDRNVYDIQSGASLYITNQAGSSLLSQLGTTVSLDYRDSRVDPHAGGLVRVGVDFAGIGGTAHYVRTKIDGNLLHPARIDHGRRCLARLRCRPAAVISRNSEREEKIIDRFFLGGDNLRGFQSGGAGPACRGHQFDRQHRRPGHLHRDDGTAIPAADLRRFRSLWQDVRGYRLVVESDAVGRDHRVQQRVATRRRRHRRLMEDAVWSDQHRSCRGRC